MGEERLERIRPCEHGEWNVHALEPGIVNEDGSLDRDKICRGAVRREITVDYEAAARQWEAEFPCVCGPEYSERGLIAPNCEHHYAKDGSSAIVDAALGRGDTREERE